MDLGQRIREEARKAREVGEKKQSSRSVIRAIVADLTALRDEGYSWGEIATAAEAAGLRRPDQGVYSAQLLREYYSRAVAPKKPRRPRTAKAGDAPAIPTSPPADTATARKVKKSDKIEPVPGHVPPSWMSPDPKDVSIEKQRPPGADDEAAANEQWKRENVPGYDG